MVHNPTPLASVTISANGFCYNGRRYSHHALAAHNGETASLFALNCPNHHELEVCIGTEYVCIASVQAAIRPTPASLKVGDNVKIRTGVAKGLIGTLVSIRWKFEFHPFRVRINGRELGYDGSELEHV